MELDGAWNRKLTVAFIVAVALFVIGLVGLVVT